jgi:hypothetical protein
MLNERKDTSVRRRTLGPALEPSVPKMPEEKKDGGSVFGRSNVFWGRVTRWVSI